MAGPGQSLCQPEEMLPMPAGLGPEAPSPRRRGVGPGGSGHRTQELQPPGSPPGGHSIIWRVTAVTRSRRGWNKPPASGGLWTPGLESGQTTTVEGVKPHPPADNCITDLLSIALPTRAKPSFPHSQSLPSGSLKKPLILIHQRADRRSKNYNSIASKTKITITES